jgi:hypothetical protein
VPVRSLGGVDHDPSHFVRSGTCLRIRVAL